MTITLVTAQCACHVWEVDVATGCGRCGFCGNVPIVLPFLGSRTVTV